MGAPEISIRLLPFGTNNAYGVWTGVIFSARSPVPSVWRTSLTSRLPLLAQKKRKKITPVMQANQV